jgi:hypothetical protein
MVIVGGPHMQSKAKGIIHTLTSVAIALTPVSGFSDRGDDMVAREKQSKLEQACDKVVVTSQDFVTGNMLIDWLGNVNSAKISSPTNYAREFITIERGTDDPKYQKLHVVVPEHKKVQVAHHLLWTFDEKKAPAGRSFTVDLTPDKIDYVLVHNGDKYVIDTKKMRHYQADPAKTLGRHISAMAAGNNCTITVDRKSLDAHISKRHGSQAKQIREAIAKAGDEPLAQRYAQMSDTEIMARHVPETLAQSMYKDAAQLGVTIEDVRTVAAEGRKLEGSRFVGEYNPSAPGIEYGVWGERIARQAVLDRYKLDKKFNHGITPFDPSIGYTRGSRVALSDSQLLKLVGQNTMDEMNAKSVPSKTFSEKGVDGLIGQMVVIRNRDVCHALAENTVAYDTATMQFVGKPTKEDVPLKNFYGDFKIGEHPTNKSDRFYGIKYDVQGCSLQKVNPLK